MRGKSMVVGNSGWYETGISGFARKKCSPPKLVSYGSNFSIGMNLFLKLCSAPRPL